MVEHERLGAGIAKIKPTNIVWVLDKGWIEKIERHGFTIASDFSGTAHSFQGATLEAAITDCNEWNVMPSRKDQLTAYMCLNRIESADALRIVQPFSPQLFRQGDLPGPTFFLKFWRKELTSEEVYTAWKNEMKKTKSRGTDWPQEMPLFCRGCSDGIETESRKPLKEFPQRSKAQIFHNLLAQGMECFCIACLKSGRIKQIAEEELEDTFPDDEVPDGLLRRPKVGPDIEGGATARAHGCSGGVPTA